MGDSQQLKSLYIHTHSKLPLTSDGSCRAKHRQSYPVVTLYPGGMAMHLLLALSQPQYGSLERMHSLQVSP